MPAPLLAAAGTAAVRGVAMAAKSGTNASITGLKSAGRSAINTTKAPSAPLAKIPSAAESGAPSATRVSSPPSSAMHRLSGAAQGATRALRSAREKNVPQTIEGAAHMALQWPSRWALRTAWFSGILSAETFFGPLIALGYIFFHHIMSAVFKHEWFCKLGDELKVIPQPVAYILEVVTLYSALLALLFIGLTLLGVAVATVGCATAPLECGTAIFKQMVFGSGTLSSTNP